MKGKNPMLATNHDAPAWIGRALRRPEPPKNKSDLTVDTDRLIWDKEYRDEIRNSLKAGGGKT